MSPESATSVSPPISLKRARVLVVDDAHVDRVRGLRERRALGRLEIDRARGQSRDAVRTEAVEIVARRQARFVSA